MLKFEGAKGDRATGGLGTLLPLGATGGGNGAAGLLLVLLGKLLFIKGPGGGGGGGTLSLLGMGGEFLLGGIGILLVNGC